MTLYDYFVYNVVLDSIEVYVDNNLVCSAPTSEMLIRDYSYNLYRRYIIVNIKKEASTLKIFLERG